ncbi:MAG TPA: radical SAM family heme chaperone HemW [Nannocystis exedens]|nr:radical SAM family heme chaperone HemW [Nannocystis exedens]
MRSGLYVHVPFCARACPYCDFDFEVGREPAVDRYFKGLEMELRQREAIGARSYDTVYVGGGTPSLLGEVGLRRLFSWIERSFPGSGGHETTVELNPEHVTAGLLDLLIGVGIDRISLGVQTLDAEGLVQLGRVHSAEQATLAIVQARRRGLRVSADLIVGWPGQSAASLHLDVERLVAAGVGHVSVYALTIERATPWPKLVRRGLRVLPDVDAQAEMLELSERALVRAGLRHYEVASYAVLGEEARHNLLYWTWSEYVGIGPSAASARFSAEGGVVRRSNARGIDLWSAGAVPSIERLDPEQAAREGLWVGLRVLDGIDVVDFLRAFPAVDRGWIERRIKRPLELGNIEWIDRGRGLRVCPGRWLWHDSVGSAILG